MSFTRFPRLSEQLPGPRAPGVCQGCGRTKDELEAFDIALVTWSECDDDDKRTNVWVLLCTACDGRDEDGNVLAKGKRQPDRRSSKGLIDRHPRLYEQMHPNYPTQGALALCQDCPWREGLTCTCPLARFNGGSGMLMTVGDRMHLDYNVGGRRRGTTIYSDPCSRCAGAELPRRLAELGSSVVPPSKPEPVAMPEVPKILGRDALELDFFAFEPVAEED